MQAALREFRINIKNFAFLKNFRLKVLDPSPCLPLVDDSGEDVWGSDPVHPLPHGFRLLVDMFETEIEQLQGKSRKRAGSTLQPPSKRSKPAARPAWISQQTATAVSQERVRRRGARRPRSRRPRLPKMYSTVEFNSLKKLYLSDRTTSQCCVSGF